MAPDLNSLPLLSPQTLQPVSPLAQVPNILPSNTSAVTQASGPASPAMPVHTSTVEDNSAVGSGPGPIRHPRPLTAAELHSELEREQEAVVSLISASLLPQEGQTHRYHRSTVSLESFPCSAPLRMLLWLRTAPPSPALVSQMVQTQTTSFPVPLSLNHLRVQETTTAPPHPLAASIGPVQLLLPAPLEFQMVCRAVVSQTTPGKA